MKRPFASTAAISRFDELPTIRVNGLVYVERAALESWLNLQIGAWTRSALLGSRQPAVRGLSRAPRAVAL